MPLLRSCAFQFPASCPCAASSQVELAILSLTRKYSTAATDSPVVTGSFLIVIGAMFTFTSLQGAKSDSTAVQSILELDGGVKVLVDVGWDETFDPQKLKELEK